MGVVSAVVLENEPDQAQHQQRRSGDNDPGGEHEAEADNRCATQRPEAATNCGAVEPIVDVRLVLQRVVFRSSGRGYTRFDVCSTKKAMRNAGEPVKMSRTMPVSSFDQKP